MAKVIYKLGNDISTDEIYPGRYMATVLPTETPQYAFDDIEELNDILVNKKYDTDQPVIAAGKNFGCGSSREQAASTLKGHDVIVIANHFARIFLQNAINLGLRTISCPEFEADTGDELEISETEVYNKTKDKKFSIKPLPEARKAIVDSGGLIPYARKKLLDNQ